MVTEPLKEEKLYTPPPSSGAELKVMRDLLMVSVPKLATPPPSEKSSAGADVIELPLMMLLTTLIEPTL